MGVASSDTGVGSNHSTNDQLTYLTRLTICPLQTLFKFAITFFEIPPRIRRVDCRPTRITPFAATGVFIGSGKRLEPTGEISAATQWHQHSCRTPQ